MIKLGFIGAGGYGKVHLEGFLPLQASGQIQIRALADPSAQALEEAARLPGVAKAGRFADYREMIDSVPLDGVVVSTPIPFHYEMTRELLERDLFVLLEKPPVPLLSQARELRELDPNRRVMIGFQHIYSRLIASVKKRFWSGELGRPLSVSAWGIWPRDQRYYRRAGWAGHLEWKNRPTLDGPATNAMAHFLNLLLFLGGSDAGSFSQPVEVEGEAYRARPIPSYDLCAVRGLLASGVRFGAVFSHAGAAQHPVSITLTGTKGQWQLRHNALHLTDSDGCIIESGEDGRNQLRHGFVAFAEGDGTQNRTDLGSMESYLLATNLMFQSSGGIHCVPGPEIECLRSGQEDSLYTVRNLPGIFSKSAETLSPLIGCGADWAIPCRTLPVEDHSESRLRKMLGLSLSGESSSLLKPSPANAIR